MSENDAFAVWGMEIVDQPGLCQDRSNKKKWFSSVLENLLLWFWVQLSLPVLFGLFELMGFISVSDSGLRLFCASLW